MLIRGGVGGGAGLHWLYTNLAQHFCKAHVLAVRGDGEEAELEQPGMRDY